MRALGGLLAAAGTAMTFYATWASSVRPRPRDLAWSLAAALAVVVALTGAVLVFVPGFFASS